MRQHLLFHTLCLLLAGSLLFAGGPIGRLNSGTAAKHDTSQTLVFNVDAGNLPGHNRDDVKRYIREEFADWNDIAGSTLRIEEGADTPENINTRDGIITALQQGLNPIAFDADGQIFEDYGFDGNVLAFAGPYSTGGSTYTNMFAVIGGDAAIGESESGLRATMLHEFGHALGLGHSAVNGEYRMTGGGSEYETFGRPPGDTLEIMYWIDIPATPDLKRDDISGYLALYGDSDQGTAGLGAISGRVLLADGTPADGINVIVRDRSGGGRYDFCQQCILHYLL